MDVAHAVSATQGRVAMRSMTLACRAGAQTQPPPAANSFPDPEGSVLPIRPGHALARGCAVKPDWAALTQQVKAANDIVAVVGSYVNLRPAGQTYKGLCPFHLDKHPSFDVDPRRQRYRCWACNKAGDVISFVQEFEHISFIEAREMLARRAGISLENFAGKAPGPSRAAMFDVMRWAAEQFQTCLLESPLAEAARVYLGERKLTGETVRRFGLGYAPGAGSWLVKQAALARMSAELLEMVGLIAKRAEDQSTYDRFRDRIMFPIRDVQGRTVGFGGRILPSSPFADRAPKYYNSSETPLFSKSEQLYGIDQARQAAGKAGYLAIVEGYTDVMMAHQHGIGNVVATMGTALNTRHVHQLRRFADRVVLVFDADAGGEGGVDRALEIFVGHDIDLRIAGLPGGMDPCDLLAAHGPEPFRKALEDAADVLEYKLERVWATEAPSGVEGKRRAVEQLLALLAAADDERSVKLALMVNRIAHRLNLKEETLWSRFRELRAARRAAAGAGEPSAVRGRLASDANRPLMALGSPAADPQAADHAAKAPRHEVQLLEVLLAYPDLVVRARAEVKPDELEHPGLRFLLEGLYRMDAEGVQPDLDHLRERLDNEKTGLLEKAQQLQEHGLEILDGAGEVRGVIQRFIDRRITHLKQALRERLEAGDTQAALALQERLRELSQRLANNHPDS
jgi:DNA primase